MLTLAGDFHLIIETPVSSCLALSSTFKWYLLSPHAPVAEFGICQSFFFYV